MRRWNARENLLLTKAIVWINIAVFVYTALDGGDFLSGGGRLERSMAVSGPTVAAGEWWRLVSSGFVHYGPIHLAFNMVILYRLGMMLEPPLGRIRMVALYMAALLAGSFGALLLAPRAFTAGASGAVFGVVGAAVVALRQRGADVWHTDVGGLLLVNLVLTFVIPGISIGGHLGGLAGGALVGGVMLRAPRERWAMAQGLAAAVVVAAAAFAGGMWAAQRPL